MKSGFLKLPWQKRAAALRGQASPHGEQIAKLEPAIELRSGGAAVSGGTTELALVRGLFIIGAARSGTTVLQNALNDAGTIYLFGEPRFHEDPGSADFAMRYNAMHRAWGNQETKSSFCPALFERDAPWFDYLVRLSAWHRYVGSKIVVNPQHAAETCRLVFDFQCRHFYDAHYVFTFRNPIDVLVSTRGLAELNGDEIAPCEIVLRGFLCVMALYIRMLRTLPAVHVLFHERTDAAAFGRLADDLGVDLTHAHQYYDGQHVRRYSLQDVPVPSRALAQEVSQLYELFSDEAGQGFSLTQLEQNAGHFDEKHYTALGSLDRRVQQLLASV